ncbi:hypothetical protein [Azospirillum argentinense]|uniref:hypothetical protein n=1 Tax=Azospirillum argentinense TaxID=2970906 RepID=UPI0010C0066C|nr:hypothetical protein [Azospirillum argentinense]
MTAADAHKNFRATISKMRFAILLQPGLADRDRRVGLVMLEQVSRQVWHSAGMLLTWISVDRLAGALKECRRNVQRARAALKNAGILEVIDAGGRGRKDSAQLAFSLDWLAAAERDQRAQGLFAQLGYADDDSDQGDTIVALNGPAAPSGRGAQDDTTVTLAGSRGDGGVAPCAATGQGDGRVTLSAPAPASAPVGKSAAALPPVDNPGRGAAVDELRVTPVAAKGDKQAPVRATPVSPEPCINPETNPARERARRLVRAGQTAPPDRAQGSFMLPIAGAMASSEAKAERRSETLLDRAGRLLSNRGAGSLAVSALQSTDPELYDGIMRGRPVKDLVLKQALLGALDAVQGDTPVTPAAPPPVIDEARIAGVVVAAIQAATPGIIAAAMQALRSGDAVAAA